MILRDAAPADLPAIVELLADAGLPPQGVAEDLDAFMVAECDGVLVGVGGLELYGAAAGLLRSLAVAQAHRRRGLGRRLCQRLEAEAAARGVDRLYLLTETAQRFFAAREYGVISRADAPSEIVSSQEFATLCPQSASLMMRETEAPSNEEATGEASP